MDRAEKRKLERENQRQEKQKAKEKRLLVDWFKNWTPQQRQFHENMLSVMLDKVSDITEKVLDSCYIASMVQTLDISLEKCEKVAKLANNYMIETKNIIEKEKEGYFDMIKDEKIRDGIREEATKLLKNGQIMSKGVIELRNRPEYSKFSYKDINIIWAEAKEELGANKTKGFIKKTSTEEEREELLETIGKKDINPKIEKCPIPYVVSKKEIEEERTITIEEASKLEVVKAEFVNPNKPKLKIKSIEIEGEYGTYIKGENGVKTEKIFVKDIKDLEEYKNTVQSEFDKGNQELSKQIEDIKQEIINLAKRANKNFNIIAEIESVFNM